MNNTITMNERTISWDDQTYYHGDTDDSDTGPFFSPRTAQHRLRVENASRRTFARTIFNWSILYYVCINQGGRLDMIHPGHGRLWVRFRFRFLQITDNFNLVPRLTVYPPLTPR